MKKYHSKFIWCGNNIYNCMNKHLKTTLNDYLNEHLNQTQNKNQNQTPELININDVKTEKEMILVDTKNVNDIISISKSGKMPLDKLRVMSMVDKLSKGETLPPIKINHDNLLIDGHHRYMAYKLANIKQIPFVWFNI